MVVLTNTPGQRGQGTGGKMRLICPNCGAQYEVPSEVIPETGRDVQCSNCGDTWFQHHPDHPAPEPESETESESAPATQSSQVSWDSPEERPADPEDQAERDAEPAPEPAPEEDPEQTEAKNEDDAEDTSQDPEETDDQDEPPAPSRRQLDPAIADVLREEAEHEREARATESAGSLESQPDLGLTQDHDDDDDRRSREARARMARLRGEEDNVGQAPDSTPEAQNIDPSSRRDLLPDIDEINSSLDAGAPAPTQDTSDLDEMRHREYTPRKSSGFKRGFSFAIVLAALLLALYIFAPRIAEMVPALAGPLEIYVEQVNALRAMVDNQFGWVREWLQDMSSPATPGE